MAKTIIHSKFEDSQISRLNEYFHVVERTRRAGRYPRQGVGKFRSTLNPSGGGACRPAQINRAILLSSNNSHALTVQGLSDSPLVLNDSHAQKSPSEDEESAIQELALSAASSTAARCQLPSRPAQVASAGSDGGSFEGLLQRSPTTINP
jgi:hypothetical protein